MIGQKCKRSNTFSLLLLMTLPVYADPVSRRLFDLLTECSLSELFSNYSGTAGVSLPGDHIPGVPPVPIPNTAVKPRVANGSRTLGPARVGRCQVYGPVLRKKGRASFLPIRLCDGFSIASRSPHRGLGPRTGTLGRPTGSIPQKTCGRFLGRYARSIGLEPSLPQDVRQIKMSS